MAEWTVLEHGALQQHAENLWTIEGSLPNMGLPRTCTVIRRDDGGVLLHSAIALSDEGMAALAALGPLAGIIVPNAMHRLDAPAYKARFPDVPVYCPPEARAAVEEKVSVDATYDSFPVGDDVWMFPVDGVAGAEWVIAVRSEDGLSLVFTDTLFNLPHQSGFGGLIMRLLGSSGGPKVTRIARWMMVKDKTALGKSMARLAELPDLRRVIPGHGDIITDNAAEILRGVAATL